VQALAAGSEEIDLVGNQCGDIGLEGADTVYVASTVSRFIFQLYGAPAIKTLSYSAARLCQRSTKVSVDIAPQRLLAILRLFCCGWPRRWF
jgi:hypothetical protein